jgi:hypothetical protein
LGTRHSLRPLNFRGESFLHHSDASRREIAEVFVKFEPRHCEEQSDDTVIASEAKQSTARATVIMDCFVASLLAMTTLAV